MSTPQPFLVSAIRAGADGLSRAQVLVSGCVDYSMFAHAAAALGVRLRATSRASTSREQNAHRWRQVALASASWWPAVSALPVAELCERVCRFVRRQERNAVYRESDVVDLFTAAGFNNVDCRLATVAGRRFARLIAS